MNTNRIRDILSRDKRTRDTFRGVFARNELPTTATTGLYVCNTDPIDKPGGHWVVIYIDKNKRAEYFDSFGLPPLFDEFEQFMINNSKFWLHNSKVVQDVYSSACGHHCIFFCIQRSIGFDMGAIANMYTSNTTFNDEIAQKFVYDKVLML